MATEQMGNTPAKPELTAFESMVRYVRVRSPEDAHFVEFDFAINDPSLFVELVLPRDAFTTFCRANRVVPMSQAQMEAVDAEMEKWRYGEDTLMSHIHAQPSSQ